MLHSWFRRKCRLYMHYTLFTYIFTFTSDACIIQLKFFFNIAKGCIYIVFPDDGNLTIKIFWINNDLTLVLYQQQVLGWLKYFIYFSNAHRWGRRYVSVRRNCIISDVHLIWFFQKIWCYIVEITFLSNFYSCVLCAKKLYFRVRGVQTLINTCIEDLR